MKKLLFGLIIAFAILIAFLTQFSFQIGNLHIGKQVRLKTKQVENFEKSIFNSQYYSKEKLLVINIWATWCLPCVGEIPDLNQVKTIYKNNDVTFLSLSVDNDSLKLEKFIKTNKFKYNDITFENLKYRDAILNTLEGEEAGKKRSIESVPITYLLKGRKIVAKINGTIDKNELINLINLNK